MDDPWAAAGFLDEAPGQKAPPTAAPPSEDAWEAAGFSDHPTEAPKVGAAAPAKKPFGLADTWPARLAKQAWGAVTLPGDVYAGKVDPLSDEAIGRSFDLATVANPVPPGMRAGETMFAAPAAAPAESTAGMRAGQTAAELGAPLSVGLASDKPAVQAVTQAARQLPFVGPAIGEGAAKTVEAAGEGVGGLARELGSGVTDRATVGANVRPALESVVEANNKTIDQAFGTLRGKIDADRPVALPKTSQVLDKIISERRSAGQLKPETGLEDFINLGTQPTSFNGLQRARSDLGHMIDFGKANPGYNAGDLKRLYGALTQDMEHVASQTVTPGVPPAQAVSALRQANQTAAPIFEFNKTLKQLTNNQRDEGLIGSLVSAANAKTGNVQLLAKLRTSMPAQDFQQIAGVALSELGYSPKLNAFSLNQFTTKWNTLGQQAKTVLFSPQHQKFLDDIANLGAHLKDADKFLNTSNTGGSVNLGAVLGGVGTAGAAALAGSWWPVLAAAGAAGGGYLLAKALGREATAASIAAWARALRGVSQNATPQRIAALRLAERNVMNNLPELQDMNERMNLQTTKEGLPFYQATNPANRTPAKALPLP